MESRVAIDALAALAHDGRLAVFRLLMRRAPGEVAAGEIAQALEIRATTLSNQLTALEAAGLIRGRRDGRAVLYSAALDHAGALMGFLVGACCQGRPEICAPLAAPMLRRAADWEDGVVAEDKIYNVLFLCTHNSARSIFAEAILNRVANGRFRAFSAGSSPAGAVHPQSAHLLKTLNYDPSQYRSKSWSEFAGPDAPALDFVFTVCDQAANEPCPVWPGQPMSAHWGLPDPVSARGDTDAEKAVAFNEAYRHLFNRISAFTSLPLHAIDSLTLQKRLDEIGRMTSAEGAPAIPT